MPHPTSFLIATAWFVTLGAVLSPAEERTVAKTWSPASALIVAAADGDRDGAIGSAEWIAWIETLPGEPADLDTDPLIATLVHSLLDADGNRILSRAELEPLHPNRDRDGDGSVDQVELGAPPLEDPDSSSGLGLDRNYAEEIALLAADTNHDRRITKSEWAQFLGSSPGDADAFGYSPESLAGWIASAARTHASSSETFTPRAYIETLRTEIDRDPDGRIQRNELRQHFAALDKNDDGVIDPDERAPPRRRAPLSGPSNGEPLTASAETGSPARIEWQRNLDDAIALSKSTGRPMLICVNMDGEVACDTLAKQRYLDPDFVRLTEGFVPLIASPNTHRDREYDDFGRRLVDPRFGSVLESEHIEIEPLLFERYFNKRRVAPRHVGVSPTGEILFDIFLVGRLSVIDDALRKHGSPSEAPAEPGTLDDRALLLNPSARHRDELEERFARSDESTRRRLAEDALSDRRDTQHPQIIRLALRDPSAAVRIAAAHTVRRHADQVSHAYLVEAFRVAGDDNGLLFGLVEAVSGRANRTEEDENRSRSLLLANVFDALRLQSRVIDTTSWARALRGRSTTSRSLDRADLYENLSRLSDQLHANSGDPLLREQLAEASLITAEWEVSRGGNPGFLFQDAQNLARRASPDGSPRPRALAVLSAASHQLDDADDAAMAAIQALPDLIATPADPLVAKALRALAWALQKRLYQAMREESDWPASRLTDLIAAYEVLLLHPSGTSEDALRFLDLLGALEVHYQQGQVARRAVARFPGSGPLHNYLRFLVLRDHGARALESAYASIDVDTSDRPTWDWYTGLATLIAAERHVQDARYSEALNAYQRATSRLALSGIAEPAFADTAAHYVCIARAGEARLHHDAGRIGEALNAIHRGLSARPEARGAMDGLGRMPVETARQISATARASRVRDALFLDRVLENAAR